MYIPQMFYNYYLLLSNVIWCQNRASEMVSLCKPPNPLFFTGNTAQNWRDFEAMLERKPELQIQQGDGSISKIYCSPRKNIIYERYGFWAIQQNADETVDAYLMRVQMKIDLCEYDKEGWPPAVWQELIRDKFVFGLTDNS